MKFSESVENLIPALIEVQGAMATPKKSRTGQTGNQKYKYADLSDIMEILQPLFFKQKLFISHPFEVGDGWIKVSTLLKHSSGEWVESGSLMLKGNVANEKEQGKLLTYGKRYSLCALMGIAADEDTDGQQTEEPLRNQNQQQRNNQYQKKKPAPQQQQTTPAQQKQQTQTAQPVAKMTEETLTKIKDIWNLTALSLDVLDKQTDKYFKLPLNELSESQGQKLLEIFAAKKSEGVEQKKNRYAGLFAAGKEQKLSQEQVKEKVYEKYSIESLTDLDDIKLAEAAKWIKTYGQKKVS